VPVSILIAANAFARQNTPFTHLFAAASAAAIFATVNRYW
jgi:hypothetical protein